MGVKLQTKKPKRRGKFGFKREFFRAGKCPIYWESEKIALKRKGLRPENGRSPVMWDILDSNQ